MGQSINIMSKPAKRTESGALVRQQRTTSGTTDHSHVVKIGLVGDSDTGKSSLMLRFVDDTFMTSTFIPTIGVVFGAKIVNLDGLGVYIHIWDTGGHEDLRNITQTYYHPGYGSTDLTGIMVVYSATKESTFDSVSYWLDDIKKILNAPPGVPVILVGNKCDLVEEKEVEYERARDFADERGLLLFETSAKDGTNVELAFLAFTAYILESCQISISDTGKV